MDSVLVGVSTSLVDRDWVRNIKSIRVSQDLFDDLSEDEAESELAHALRNTIQPPGYRRPTVITRPFDQAVYENAIAYPFTVWSCSRYGDGSFGVWYGADSVETSVYETTYHWVKWLSELTYSEAFAKAGDVVTGERRLYDVRCNALLLDFRKKVTKHPQLVDPTSYDFTQRLGSRLHHEGHPALLTRSARCSGDMVAVLQEAVLSNPRDRCFMTYHGMLGSNTVTVQRNQGTRMKIVVDL